MLFYTKVTEKYYIKVIYQCSSRSRKHCLICESRSCPDRPDRKSSLRNERITRAWTLAIDGNDHILFICFHFHMLNSKKKEIMTR